MKLAGLSACVPENKVQSTAAYANFKQFDVDRIVENTGVVEKREALPGVTAIDLCISAAGPLLEALDWAPQTVDACVFITMSPDYIMPASAYRVQTALGLPPRCLIFDVNLGCSGYTHGLILMHSLIESGLIKRGLLLCGEETSGTIRPRLPDAVHRSDLANAILFGDAGSATAVSNEGEDQVKAKQFGADGSGLETIIVPGGMSRNFCSPEVLERREDKDGETRRPLDLILKGPEILTFTMKRVPPLMKDLLAQSGWGIDDVDAFVPHQANKFMLTFLGRRTKVPKGKMLMSIEKFGNTSSASIPLTMVVDGGEHLTRPTKWNLMGFGVGLSWSGLMIETDSITTVPLIEV